MHSGSKRAGSRENVAVGKAPAQRRFPGGEARLFAAASGCICVRIAARSSAPFEAPPPRHGAEVLRAGGNVGRARFSQKRYRAAQVPKSGSTAMAALLACGKVGSVPRERHAVVGDAACLRQGWFCAPRASCPCRRRCLPAARALRKARPGSCAERFGVGASFCMQVTVDRTRGTARSGCAPSPPGFSPRRRGYGGRRPHPLKGRRPLRIPFAAALGPKRSTHAPLRASPPVGGATAGPARTRSRAIGP